MNVEKTIEFILASQARTEAALDRMAERTEARFAAVDKRLNATVKLIQVGMKLLVNVQKTQQEMDGKLNALVDAQQRAEARMDRQEARMDRFDARMDRLTASQDRTEKTLNRFIASLTRKNKNGHPR